MYLVLGCVERIKRSAAGYTKAPTGQPFLCLGVGSVALLLVGAGRMLGPLRSILMLDWGGGVGCLEDDKLPHSS